MYTLKKSLGQHFLHDKQIIRKIVDTLTLDGLKQLLEIGPGGAALTQHLMELPNVNFKAVEVDDDKIKYLLQTYPKLKDRIIHQDVLHMQLPFEGPFAVIGNFPYNISSPIMFKILEWQEQVTEVIGMFQKEVAVRIAAGHGNKDYGILSVLLQAYFKVEYLFDVHENCFTPPPKVKSGVVRFSGNQNAYDIQDKKAFIRLVKAAFSQRRKTLRNALKSSFDASKLQDDIFNKRAEQLSVSDFVALHFQLQRQ